MRPFALPTVLLLLLAGCSGGSADTDTADDDAQGRTSGDGDAAIVPPTEFEEVAWDGELGTHFCVSPGSDICPVSTLGPPTDPLDRSRLLFVSETEGATRLSGNLTLTWDAADFAITSNLQAVLGAYTGCPDACSFVRAEATSSGRSPLELPLAAVKLQDGERLGLYLRPTHSNVANNQFTVGAGQAVHLAGTIGSAPFA